jgi:FtsH-binding integral membrane protein
VLTVRQVYAVLSMQLVLTVAVCCLTTLTESVRLYVLSNPGLAILGIVLSIVLLIALFW